MNKHYGLDKGQDEFSVIEGSAWLQKDIELSVNLEKGLTKEDVLVQLQRIRNHLISVEWPPEA